MTLKFFHLNIQGGIRLEDVASYIKQNNFDIIQLQEVASGVLSKTGQDNFSYLQQSLPEYDSLMSKTMQVGENDTPSYFGNATFYKKAFTLQEKEIVWLKPYEEYTVSPERDVESIKNQPRNAVALKLAIKDTSLWTVNTHMAWGPTPLDEPYKIAQGAILESFLKNLTDPFILSGDFNVTPDSQIVKAIDNLAINHTKQAGLTNTLNPVIHRVKKLFPVGLAVDYIYTSKELRTQNFRLVVKPDLSDHLGLSIEVIIS